MKKLRKTAAVFLLCAGILAGCGSKKDTKAEKRIPMVSVAQTVEHKSLNTIRDSFKAEMGTLGYKDGGNIELDFRDAGGQRNTLNSIMSTFVGNKNDVTMAIATPTAMAAAKYSKDIPIVFSAVNSPVGAGLMDDLKKPNNNVIGTSDEIQVDQILDLTSKVGSSLKTLDFIYNSSEVNSVNNLAETKELCKEHDIRLVEESGVNITEIRSAVSVLTDKCDVIFAPSDSTVAGSMNALVETTNKKKVPVYTDTDSVISDGGFATAGIDYTELDKETARVTDRILRGEDVKNLPVKVFKDNLNIYVSKETVETLGVQLPEDIENSKNLVMM